VGNYTIVSRRRLQIGYTHCGPGLLSLKFHKMQVESGKGRGPSVGGIVSESDEILLGGKPRGGGKQIMAGGQW